MERNQARAAEARAWLAKAALDLRAAQFEMQAGEELAADIAFHAQQSAEKALKGFLAWHDKPFRRTHSLVELGGQCSALDTALEGLLRRAATLSEYAWKFRYPGEPDLPSVEEAAQALALAREVFDAVLARLPEAAGPRP